MNKPSGPNQQLLEEISVLKNRIKELEQSEARRTQTAEALKRSGSIPRTFLDLPLDISFVMDRDGILLDFNDSLTGRLGKTRKELVGRCVYDLLPPAVAKSRRAKVAEVLETGRALRFEDRNGESWYDSILYPVPDESGKTAKIGVLSYEITKRKRAEEALRHSEWRFRTLLENIKDGVCITGPDRKFIFVNDIVVERSGRPREWYLESTAVDLVAPELRESVRALGNKSISGEKVPPFEVFYLNASGNELWMECHIASLFENGEFAGFLTINRDITERKRLEQELKKHRDHMEQLVAERTTALVESERKYRELVDNAVVGIYQTTLDGRILYHNDYLLRMLGYDSLEAIKATHASIRYKNKAERESHLKILRETGKVMKFEAEFLTTGGESLNVLISARLNRDIISGMVLDITDRKKAEEELKARTEQLNESNLALKVLLDQRDKDRHDMEERLASNVKHLVLPYLEDLSGMSLGRRQETLVSVARANLDQIVSPFLKNLHYQYISFTPAELKVAGFIKDGRTVKEIANILGISESAVNSHRQHIRNKLGLKDKKVNLRAHLQSLGATPQPIH